MTTSSSSLVLRARGLSYRLPDGRTLFSGLEVSQGRERTALVGGNGTGKSTLLRLLTGSLPLQEGDLFRRGVHLTLPQSSADRARTPRGRNLRRPEEVADLLGLREPLEALTRLQEGSGTPGDADAAADAWDLPERIEDGLRRVGLPWLDPWRAASTLSGGEVTRVALSGLLLRRPDLLVLDEPTNHLDALSRAALKNWLAEWEGGVLLVTHDRSLLEVVDRVLELGTSAPPGLAASGGDRSASGGPHHQWVSGGLAEWTAARELRERSARQVWEQAEEERRRRNRTGRAALQRQERRGARGKRAAVGSNQAKILLGARARQAQVTTGQVRRRVHDDRHEAERAVQLARARTVLSGRIAWRPPAVSLPSTREAFRLEAAAVEGRLAPVTCGLAPGGRLAVTGPNGSGKSTLLRLLAGELAPTAGKVLVAGSREGAAFLPQDPPEAPTGATVLDRMRDGLAGLPEARIREILAAFLFPADTVERRLEELSGGERVRLELARILGSPVPPPLLLLDEPTNHLDLPGVLGVEEVLRSYRGTLVVVSHDAHFLQGLGLDAEIRLESPRSLNPTVTRTPGAPPP